MSCLTDRNNQFHYSLSLTNTTHTHAHTQVQTFVRTHLHTSWHNLLCPPPTLLSYKAYFQHWRNPGASNEDYLFCCQTSALRLLFLASNSLALSLTHLQDLWAMRCRDTKCTVSPPDHCSQSGPIKTESNIYDGAEQGAEWVWNMKHGWGMVPEGGKAEMPSNVCLFIKEDLLLTQLRGF